MVATIVLSYLSYELGRKEILSLYKPSKVERHCQIDLQIQQSQVGISK